MQYLQIISRTFDKSLPIALFYKPIGYKYLYNLYEFVHSQELDKILVGQGNRYNHLWRFTGGESPGFIHPYDRFLQGHAQSGIQ